MWALAARRCSSIKRGEGDDDAARGILANCFLMLCVFSVALPAAILPFREPMLRLFGASDATYPYAEAYFTALPAGYALSRCWPPA